MEGLHRAFVNSTIRVVASFVLKNKYVSREAICPYEYHWTANEQLLVQDAFE